MPEPTVEQFLKDIRDWKPGEATAEGLRRALALGRTPQDQVEPLAQGLLVSAKATYRYLETVHDLTRYAQIDRTNFVIRLAQVVESMDGLKHGGALLRNAFADYNALVQSSLKQDRFDTLYFDDIQNFDVKGSLQHVLKDVELLLRSFSLVSAELSGVKCLELYEDCVRFHLYLQYLTRAGKLPLEECWSILFDLNNLFSGGDGGSAEDFEEDLEAFRMELEEIRKNNRN